MYGVYVEIYEELQFERGNYVMGKFGKFLLLLFPSATLSRGHLPVQKFAHHNNSPPQHFFRHCPSPLV